MQEYKIKLGTPKIKDLDSICVVLENCDVVEFFQNEIEEMDLVFETELELSGGDIIRKLKSGLLKISIKEKYNMRRMPLIGMPNRRKRPKTEELLERLQGVCDITWLEITNADDYWRETIEVPYEELEDDETGKFIALTVCSSARIDSDGKLVILMGDKSEYIPE